MGRSCFLKLLLVSSLLLISFSHGFGRNLVIFKHEDSSVHLKENGAAPRRMIEVMDYEDPGPNINTRTGYIFSPPPQIQY